MGKDSRHLVSAGAAFLCLLAAALPALPVAAGVNRWTAIGPDGADVAALAIDPLTTSTAFAGTLGSGVLKSTDGGASWQSANGALPTAYIPALAIDPATPSTIFAGTDAGVFKSTDGGQNWIAANVGLLAAPQVTVNALVIDPRLPATVYAATSGGAFKTTDGAAHWTRMNAGPSIPTPGLIAIDPVSPSTVYLGVNDDFGYADGIIKSTDAGASWKRIYTTPVENFYDVVEGYFTVFLSVTALVIDPLLPSRLYLIVDGGLVRSFDGGASWSHIMSVPEGGISSLAVDPASSTTLYAGTYSGSIFRTTDAGDHWALAMDSPLHSLGVNAFATTASAPATVYAGSGSGIFQSLDRGLSWTRLTTGVRTTRVSPLAVDPTSPSTIYSAYDDVAGAFTKTTDGGAHWSDSSLGVPGQTVNSLVIDPSAPSTLYAGMGGAGSGANVYKSTDAGAHWAPMTKDKFALDIQALAIAPSRSSTLYAGMANAGIYKSSDGGVSWTLADDGLTTTRTDVSALAVDPTSADVVHVATPSIGAQNGLNGVDAKFFKTTDGAAHWRQVPIALPPGSNFTSLVVDPATPSTIYAAYVDYAAGLGGVIKSRDGGESWTAPQSLISTVWGLALAIDPHSSSQIYAATQSGVFRSTDAAASWAPLNAGLAILNVWSLAVDRTGSLLRATTSGGLFEYQVSANGATVPVIEYVHAAFGHYFITSIPDEISKLDNGLFAGWVRTGFQFNVYAAPNPNSAPVCRFFSTAFAPKSSHFYTPFAAECATRQSDPSWSLESADAFDIAVPAADGSCAAGFAPVYRLYNNGQGGAPNHRYTTDLTVRAQMIAQGWVPEGLGSNAVEMCSPQ